MNLSTNCCKHVLAELKQEHVAQVAQLPSCRTTAVDKRFPDLKCIDRIKPPAWSPVLLTGLLPQGFDQAPSGNDGSNDDDDNADHRDSTIMGALLGIERDLSASELCPWQQCPQQAQRRDTDYQAITKGIQALASAKSHGQKRKRARGNFGFFQHVANTRVLLARNPGEVKGEFEKRVRVHAKETWKDLHLVNAQAFEATRTVLINNNCVCMYTPYTVYQYHLQYTYKCKCHPAICAM